MYLQYINYLLAIFGVCQANFLDFALPGGKRPSNTPVQNPSTPDQKVILINKGTEEQPIVPVYIQKPKHTKTHRHPHHHHHHHHKHPKTYYETDYPGTESNYQDDYPVPDYDDYSNEAYAEPEPKGEQPDIIHNKNSVYFNYAPRNGDYGTDSNINTNGPHSGDGNGPFGSDDDRPKIITNKGSTYFDYSPVNKRWNTDANEDSNGPSNLDYGSDEYLKSGSSEEGHQYESEEYYVRSEEEGGEEEVGEEEEEEYGEEEEEETGHESDEQEIEYEPGPTYVYDESSRQNLFIGKYEVPEETDAPINIISSSADDVSLKPFIFTSDPNEIFTLINTGESVEVYPTSETRTTVTGGCLFDELYIFYKKRYLFTNIYNDAKFAATTVDGGEGTELEVISYFYNAECGDFESCRYQRNGQATFSFRINTYGKENPNFKPFGEKLEKIEEPGSTETLNNTEVLSWIEMPEDVEYYCLPGSYTNLKTGQKTYSSTFTVFPPIFEISPEQFHFQFGTLLDKDEEPLSDTVQQYSQKQPVIRSRGIRYENDEEGSQSEESNGGEPYDLEEGEEYETEEDEGYGSEKGEADGAEEGSK